MYEVGSIYAMLYMYTSGGGGIKDFLHGIRKEGQLVHIS